MAKGESDGSEEDSGERKRKSNRWWGTRRSTGSSTGEEVPIRFGTYNIRNRCNGGLESALRGMDQANMDLGIFQETKRTEGIYTRELAGYSVVATFAPIQHRGGVDVFYRPSPLFAVEAVRQFGPNVVSFQLATGARRWYIIGCYLSPRRHLDNREFRRRAQGAALGHRTDSGGGPKHNLVRPIEQRERNGNCGGADDGGT